MPYSTRKNSKGRIVVTSPKGKDWKTSYSSQAAADKAIAYIEGRFGSDAPSSPASPRSSPQMASTELPEDYVPPEGERGSRTVMRLRYLQDEEGF